LDISKETFFGQDKVVAPSFILRLFAQLKSCGYHNPFAQPKGCGYLYEI